MDDAQPHERLGLTAKQCRAYSLYYEGNTHEEVARIMGRPRSCVTELIGRALERNPNLPKPTDHRVRRTVAFSSLDTPKQSFARELGIH